MNFKKIALACARAADEKKAGDIIVMDVKKLTAMTDYFVICDTESTAQIKAVVESVKKALSKEKIEILHREGMINSKWVLVDYGGVVMHVFNKEVRYFYNLERLWGDAKDINWKTKVPSKKVSPKTKKSH